MDIDKFLSDAYKELDLMIKQQEDDFVELFIDDYLSDFFVDDRVDVVGLFGWWNYSCFFLLIKVNRVFHQLIQQFNLL